MKILTFILFSFILLLGYRSIALSKYYMYGTEGKAELCVPYEELDKNTLPKKRELVNLQIGNGRTPGFNFYFKKERILDNIPEFSILNKFSTHPYVNVLSGSVGFLGSSDIDRFDSSMRARNTKEIWYAIGECSKPYVVKLKGSNLYLVKCESDSDYSHIWSKPVSMDLPMPDPGELVVATCKYQSIKVGEYSGNKKRTCDRIFVTSKFIIEYKIQEENVGLVNKLDQFIMDRLIEWKVNCPNTK